jgi:ABC-type multidrug transport system fused ATPase/permease subunit
MLLVFGSLIAATRFLSIDLAVFGAIALLLLRSVSYGQQFQSSYQTIVECAPYLDMLDELRALYVSHTTVDGSLVLEGVSRIDLVDVTYSYDDQVDALAGVSASFHKGEVVGIVGPSGSGKSTLSQLLLRLRDPTRGEIRVDGTSAAQYTLSSWYRHVSLVPQDPRLIYGSVLENIAFFDPTVGRAEAEAAAHAASLQDVIESLDQGYETLLGPPFRDLSGGQIQRIGIARALARGADVIVLDEPTSALDVHSEANIQTALENLRGSALVLIIAHRLSTLSICDRILVLNKGAVESIGTLTEVAQSSQFFRRALDTGTLDIGPGASGAVPTS